MIKNVLSLLLFATVFINAQTPQFIANEVLVKLQPNKTALNLKMDYPELGITTLQLVSKPLNIWKINYALPAITEDAMVQQLFNKPEVLIAQKNHLVTLRETTPDDPLFGNQWQYFQANDRDIDADEAWDITTGGTSALGDEIVVAVVDDGYNINHPDLVDNLWINTAEIPGNGIDDDENGYIDDIHGWNAFNNSGTFPVLSHGTAVFGIVGAKGNNGIGVAGVNWDVKVMPISGSSGNEAVVLTAYSYALESRMLYNDTDGAEGAFVVATNASFGIDFGDPADFPLWCDMYNILGENGILSCGATINGNFDVDVIGDVPTACSSEYLISVTNTNINDVKVTNAGYGLETIDLGAPGANAYTTNTSSYGPFGGTSGATPHVTGTIGLLFAAPCESFAQMVKDDPAEAARRVRDYIFAGVDPNTSLAGITTTGGRLNVNNALQALMDDCEDIILSTNTLENSNLQLFPNPANQQFKIVGLQNLNNTILSIYSLDGKKVFQTTVTQNQYLDVSNLNQGTYIVEININEGENIYHKKLLKK